MTGLPTDGVVVDRVAEPDLDEPPLIEGLPGVGNVGTLVVDHLIEEGESTLLCRILSEHFPPQVAINETSTARLPSAEIHHVGFPDRDLLVLRGDQQAVTPMGHYRLAATVLDVAESTGTRRMYPIGGMPTGEIEDAPNVIGAVSREELVDPLGEHDVRFRDGEPTGGIVGVSGLLLGLGGERGLDVTCLMGETNGYTVDPRSARAVLGVLADVLDIDPDVGELEERAEEVERAVRRMGGSDQGEVGPAEEQLRYIR